MWMARSASSDAASVRAAISVRVIGGLSELRRSGRTSVRRSSAPSRCTVTEPSAAEPEPAESATVVSTLQSYTVIHTVGYTIARSDSDSTAIRPGEADGRRFGEFGGFSRRRALRRAAAAADRGRCRSDATAGGATAGVGAPAPRGRRDAGPLRRLGAAVGRGRTLGGDTAPRRRRAERPGLSQSRVRRRGVQPVLSGVDRKSTRLNSSHVAISYAVFCLNINIISVITML